MARKRKGVFEFDQESLRARRQFLNWREQDRLVVHPDRVEAFQWLSECAQAGIRLPSDWGLARIMGVSSSQGREWKKQFLTRCGSATWDRPDDEIAARANTTVRAVEVARECWQRRRASKFKPMQQSYLR